MGQGLTRLILAIALLVACPLASSATDVPIVLIANPNVPIDSLTRETIRAIFAMRQRTLPDGQAVHVFVLPDESRVHARFAKEYLGVYPHQLRLSWDRVVFSGTGQAPNHVDSQAEMVERVATTPGGIGYIEQGYLDDRVRLLPLQ
ncbi:substrate-binding domain-containing protein [Phytohalomonas tamaricis]|uniref:substrate-binding domain-containing protein n=1 Tax=Phytohalomonas tamaricis TaxID=2081032 RepID=UPI0021D443D8|nr:hypothetical protein [Phytohalomonas tamaricis]